MSASAPGWTRGHRPLPDRAHRGHGNRRGGPAATPVGSPPWPWPEQGCRLAVWTPVANPPRPVSAAALAARGPGVAREGQAAGARAVGSLRRLPGRQQRHVLVLGRKQAGRCPEPPAPAGGRRGGPLVLGRLGSWAGGRPHRPGSGRRWHGPSSQDRLRGGVGQGLRGARGSLGAASPRHPLPGRGGVGGATAPTAVHEAWTAQCLPVATAAFQRLAERRGALGVWGGWGGHAAWGGAAP